MFVIRCPEQSLKFGDSPGGGVWVQRLSPTDPISELQPKEIQLNCNKAFWKGNLALSATRFTRIFHKILLASLIQITSKELFAPGFAPCLTCLCIYYLLTNSAPSCKSQLWNINHGTVWLESKGFAYISPVLQWKKNQDRSIEFVSLGFFTIFCSLHHSPLNFSWILSFWSFSY